MIVTLAALIATVVLCAVLTVLLAKGRKKAVNMVMFVLVFIALICNFAVNGKIGKQEPYVKYGQSLSTQIVYKQTKDGYHLFENRSVGPGSDDIAVPDDVELPDYIKNIDKGNVGLIAESLPDIKNSEKIELDGETYRLVNKVEKIRPDYSFLMMCVLGCLIFSTAFANVASVVIGSMRKNKA